MKLKVFSIRDAKVEAFMQPFFSQTTGSGIRLFTDSIEGPQNGFSKHPEDYALFELGEFDQETGLLSPHPQPKSLGGAMEYMASNAFKDLQMNSADRASQQQ
nr:MAG: nonstructural protein [Microvirus sp.]